jgi:hypothetical protein
MIKASGARVSDPVQTGPPRVPEDALLSLFSVSEEGKRCAGMIAFVTLQVY